VIVRGKLSANRAADQLKATVRWCLAKTDGTFRAGLEFLDGRSRPELDEENTSYISSVIADCYELLQLSPHADAASISHAYRTLAFRYHPDNSETGNSEMFIRLCEAYEILSDPVKRASYNLRYFDAKRRRGTNLVQSSAAMEREKRAAAYLGIASLGCTVCWEG
jgi:DnaJ-domain-containing protein 1